MAGRLRVGVGSENAAKLRSVRMGCEKVFAERTEVDVIPVKVRADGRKDERGGHVQSKRAAHARGCQVPSGVSAQPMTDEETLRGAMQRAQAVLDADPIVDYGTGYAFTDPHGLTMRRHDGATGIGIEGGVQEVGGRWLECGFVVVIDRHVRLSCTLAFFSFSPCIHPGGTTGKEWRRHQRPL